MTVKERILQYLEYKKISITKAESDLGWSKSSLLKSNNLSTDKASEFVHFYKDLNSVWLLTGEGEMLKNVDVGKERKEERQNLYTAPMLPIASQGGTLNDFVMSVKITECEQVVTPIRDVDFVITVTGDSMAPDYPNGSQVLIKKVNEKAFIEWGRVYVLDTCNGSVIKEVRKGNDDDSVMCFSLNPNPKYQPFIVRFSDIYGMYRVLMCMALK